MFGDYGHGSLLLFFGTMLVLGYDYLKETGAKDILPFRYLFFMMGFFSCYNGLLYNEWFAIPYPWFKSCYITSPLPQAEYLYIFPYVDFPDPPYLTSEYDGTSCVYPFGMDPTWFLDSSNILVVQDSMKMKIAVIIGVVHMTMGIVTKGLNMQFFGNKMAFWTEVVTGVIILNALFGWMDTLIFIKWLYPMNPYSTNQDMVNRINRAPSIITIMINNFLALGKQPFTDNSGKTIDVYLFNGQRAISETLVVFVLICVPIMLFVKPCSACFCPVAAGMPEYAKHEEGTVNDHDASDPNREISTKSGIEAAVEADQQAFQEILNQENGGQHGHDLGEVFIH